jgi:penicillin amidase/acyl-homoserine-lactone acylase
VYGVHFSNSRQKKSEATSMKTKGILQIAAGITALLVLGAGVWLWHPLPKSPSPEELASLGSKHQVEIVRDEWGTPHIFGKTDADTAFGLAFAHAEDDFETIQQMVAATRGTLAVYDGASAAPTDYIVGLMDVWGTIERDYAAKVPAEVKTLADSYAQGLNLYAANHPAQQWPGLAPFRAEDIIAGFIFKTPFFYGFDRVLLGLSGDETKAEIALDPAAGRTAWHIAPTSMVRRGSNGIAVAPGRSGDDTTRLMINSHQPMTGPVAWYEAHLISEEGLNITGGTFPGVPLILHGFNDHLGWANTVSEQDLVDVYVLTRNPGNKNQYKLDGEWVDFDKTEITILVRLWGPFAFPAKRTILRSRHGPVFETDHGDYALRYAGMDEIGQLEQYYALNKSNSLVEFQASMALNALPSINYIYADAAGNVGFVHNAQYPDRKPGWDWHKQLPGDRSDLIWQGYLPYTNVPQLWNPASGLVFNSNNQPFSATDGPDNMRPEDFAPEMGLQTNQTNRSLRMMELTDGTRPIDRQRLLAIKFDTAYSSKSVAAEIVSQVVNHDWSTEPNLAIAARHLAAWDLDTGVNNVHAALGVLTTAPQITAKFTHKPVPEPQAAFRDAVAYLMDHYGRIDPAYGQINRLIRGSQNLPVDGAPDTLRAIYPQDFGEDGILRATAGDTWIALVEWKPGQPVSADLVHQFGSATMDETSPHFADQAPLFTQHKWRQALRDPDQIRAHAERTYQPTFVAARQP